VNIGENMKYLILVLMLITFNVMANPEMGRQIHFVLDKNNANHEWKPSAGSTCSGGTIPNGDGATAWGEITCEGWFTILPWYNVPGVETNLVITVDSNDLPNNPCELFDVSNNAGNNQGFDVTQYNSNNWKTRAVATPPSSISAELLDEFRNAFLTTDPDYDLNHDGIVNALDIGLLKALSETRYRIKATTLCLDGAQQ